LVAAAVSVGQSEPDRARYLAVTLRAPRCPSGAFI
jgi:hypothetical protein